MLEFGGIQKLTLLDFPGRVACTVFTKGCNLRCPYCHNASLVLDPLGGPAVTEAELFDFLEKRRGMLTGVAITGGEPLLQPWIEDVLRRLRAEGFATKLDTNGCFPDRLRSVVEAGLVDYVAMDIKNSPERYGMTVGIRNFDLTAVLESVSFLREGKVSFEFRTTAVKGFHTPEDMAAIGRWLGPVEHYYIQCYKDSGDLIGGPFGTMTDEEYDALLAAVKPYIPAAEIRGR